MCIYYMGLKSNGCFVTGATLMSGHYRTNIISGVSHSRLDSVIPLVLCTIAYNSWDTSIILWVTWDNVNSTKNV
jgi:hypothetical protein